MKAYKYPVLALFLIIGFFLPFQVAFASTVSWSQTDYSQTQSNTSGYANMGTATSTMTVVSAQVYTGPENFATRGETLFITSTPGGANECTSDVATIDLGSTGTSTWAFSTPCNLVSGTFYYFHFSNGVSSNPVYGKDPYTAYFVLYSNIAPSNNMTRVYNLSPNATTTSSSTVNLSGNVYINADEYSRSMYIEILTEPHNSLNNGLDNVPDFNVIDFPENLSSGDNSFSTTTVFDSNILLDYHVSLKKYILGIIPYTVTSTTTSFTVVQGSAIDSYFASTTDAAYSYVSNYATSTVDTSCAGSSSITEKALCSLGTIFANVFQTVLMPNSDSINQFTSIKDILTTKPPIGYIYVTINALNSLNSSSTANFTLPYNSTLDTNIFTPLKTGIAAILWFVFVAWYFIRGKNMQI